jgi:SIR2-like domain/TIR domain
MAGMDPGGSSLTSADSSTEAPARPPLKIFINYRHDDMPFAAMTLYRELKDRFGEGNIFFDGGALRPGMQFFEEIKSRLAGTAGAFIALIGPRWMSAMTARRHHADDEDYVITEIELALRHGWTVIPVLIDEARMPGPRNLVMAIRALPGYHAAYLRQTSLDDDIEDLVGRLDEIAAQPLVEPGLSTPAPVEQPVPPNPNGGTHSDKVIDVMPADDEHYQMLADEASNLVIFLGAEANSDDHEGPFRAGASMLPDDSDLAEYLAVKARFRSAQRELAEVAQYARMIRGEPKVFSWVKQILVNSEPGPVHKYLARLPGRLEQLGLEKRYQMIVTPKFDVALERAFWQAGEPFDVALYMAPGTEHAGRFIHLPWGSLEGHAILAPNEYDEFPILGDDSELTRTVIVRINGTVDDLKLRYRWKNNYVITEDHYIDYLGGRPAEEVVPTQILAKLRQANCLFLGYAIADWRLRVFLHWIWRGERPSSATHWAVERSPDALDRQFWQRSGVGLYQSRLTDYVQGLDRFLDEHRDELA